MVDPNTQSFEREFPFEEEKAEEIEVNRQRLELAENEEIEEEAEAEEAEMDEAADEEAEYANLIALQRDQEAQATTALQEEGRSFSGPSLFKYLIILLMFAIPNDLIDALDITGIGIILSWFISFFLSMITIIIMWFADSELKRVKDHMAKRGEHQKALVKTMTRAASTLTKFAPKNPVIKVMVGAALEMIPFVSILPWSSISVLLAYQDERKSYKEARESSESMGGASAEALEMV